MATAFAVPDPIEIAYRKMIYQEIKTWIPVKLKDVSPTHWLRELANVGTRRKVANSSAKIALNMITRVNVVNVKSWRDAAFEARGGRQLYNELQKELNGRLGARVREILEEQSHYISDIPSDVAKILVNELSKAAYAGMRPEALDDLLKLRFPEVMGSAIKRTARTQISAANTALTRARSEELDLPCFVWQTSKDQRVRLSHRKMNGIVVFWDDLPSPESLANQPDYLGHYAPGECPNCRCFPRPVLTLEDIFSSKNSLVKVYRRGNIETMSRVNFQRISGIESRLAA